MRIDKKHKIEKVTEKLGAKRGHEKLQHAYLRQLPSGDYRLEATDSYKAIIVPIAKSDVHENDSEGFVPVEALKLARKGSGDVVAGDAIEAGGMSMTRPTLIDGAVELQRILDGIPAWDDAGAAEVRVGVNAKMLYELAQGLGSDVVELRIGSPREPLVVLPADGSSSGARGIIMPVRLPD